MEKRQKGFFLFANSRQIPSFVPKEDIVLKEKCRWKYLWGHGILRAREENKEKNMNDKPEKKEKWRTTCGES